MPIPSIKLIYARAANGVIGQDNAMPWHLPEDLAHFKQLTQGHPVIMGRKTWDSLPPRFRPLPGRRNVIVTRQADWQAEGAHAVPTLEAALQLCSDATEIWVIGGAQIFALAEPLASQVEVTEIDQPFDGDTFAPALAAHWQESTREQRVSSQGLPFSFVSYQRQTPA